jgi:hypothetical protein
MRDDLGPVARVVHDLLGCPGLPDEFCTSAGLRRFLRGWTSGRPGSLRELGLVLGTADPAVTLAAVEEAPHRLRLHITWRRWRAGPDLAAFAPQARRFAAAVAEVIDWWRPRSVEVAWGMAWPGAALLAGPPAQPEPVMKSNPALVEMFARDILGVSRRGPVPPRGWLSLAGRAPFAARRGEVVVGNAALEAFLFNVSPFSAAVRVEREVAQPGRTELRLTALRRLSRLELLGPPGFDGAEFRLDGEPLAPRPVARWPELYAFRPAEPIKPGRTFRLSCSHVDTGALPLWANPVLFETCRWEPARNRYERDFRAGGDAPGSYPNLVRGRGPAGFIQPFALDEGSAAEEDASLFARAARVMIGRRLARRSDVARLVAGHFRGVRRVAWSEDTWSPSGAGGWAPSVEGEVARVFAACKCGASAGRLRAAVTRFLSRHETYGVPLRVEVIAEDSHE